MISARSWISMALLLALVIVLTGCETTPSRLKTAPATLFSSPQISGASTLSSIDAVFYDTLGGCSQVLNGFESEATKLKWWGAGIQLLAGAVGSIWLPAVVAGGTASKGLVAALGGFAGYGNTARSVVVNEGLGAAAILSSRASVQAAMERALFNFYSARDAEPPNRAGTATAIAQLKVACLTYSIVSPNTAQ